MKRKKFSMAIVLGEGVAVLILAAGIFIGAAVTSRVTTHVIAGQEIEIQTLNKKLVGQKAKLALYVKQSDKDTEKLRAGILLLGDRLKGRRDLLKRYGLMWSVKLIEEQEEFATRTARLGTPIDLGVGGAEKNNKITGGED